MSRFKTLLVLSLSIFSFSLSYASPGDYSLRFKGGPSFELQDWHDQMRIGAEFDYDLGYSMGIGLMALFGVSRDFRFQLLPSFRYDLVYLGPASLYGVLGAGYGRFNKNEESFDLRFGSGITLPLGDSFEVNSDVNVFMSPLGTPGTPITLDWLLSFGMKFY